MPKISALPPMTTADAADEAPIVDTSVSTTKKWTLTLLKTYLQSLVGWLTTAMLADDSVTAAKIDWASTGANGGIWWEELGRTTLGSAGDTITVSSLPARKYLMILFQVGAATSTVNNRLRFNSDSGSNYFERSASNGAADSTSASASTLGLTATDSASERFGEVYIINVLAKEKVIIANVTEAGTAGAANQTQRAEAAGKWANTAAAISSISLVNTGAGDYSIGSQLIVLGHD